MPKKNSPEKTAVKENLMVENEEKNLQDEEIDPEVEKSFEDFGQQIRETRIANNLSLESVSGHLHISVKILEAIEDGKPEKGPTPVFFRGLVRTYCQFLELDKTEFIDKIDNKLRGLGLEEEKINIKSLKPGFSVNDSFPIRNILTFVGVLIVSLLLYFAYFNEAKLDNTVENIRDVNLDNDEKLPGIETKQNTPQKNKDQIKSKENTPKESPETKNISLIENTLKSIDSPATKIENYEPLTLEVEASLGTWISLSIDDLDIQDYRIGKDEIKQWVAKYKFLLTIGNTKAVRVLLNGREIETNRNHDLLTNWLVDSKFLP